MDTDPKNSDGKKTYILDTNVLLHDPDCIIKFQEHDVMIPIACIEEFDRFKREMNERGSGARDVSRRIELLRVKARERGSSLNKGVPIGNGSQGTFYVFSNHLSESKLGLDIRGSKGVDNLCLEITKRVRDSGKDAVFVTKDINLRIKADSFNIPVDDYKHDKKGHSLEHLFQQGGIRELYLPGDDISKFFESKTASDAVPPGIELNPDWFEGNEPFINQGLIIKPGPSESGGMLARYIGKNYARQLMTRATQKIMSISAQNREQKFAIDALMCPTIRVAALLGKAGTGKSLLSIAAGAQQSLTGSRYKKIIVIRPTVTLGQGLGYLPGNLEEKEGPHMAAVHDTLEYIFDHGKEPDRQDEASYMEEIRCGHIQLTTPIFYRGRSIPNAFTVVDEAQNLTPHEVKSILTRAKNGKTIIVGDPWQRDNPYVDEESNGLTHVVRTIMGKRAYFAAEFLTRSERDEIVDDLADIL